MSRRRKSILYTVGWRLLAASLVFLALIVVSLQSRIEGTATTLFHKALADQAYGVAEQLTLGADGRVELRHSEAIASAAGVIPYRILDADGRDLVVARELPSELRHTGLPTGPWPLGMGAERADEIAFFTLGPPQVADRVVGAILPMRIGTLPVYVQAFEDLDQRGVLLDDLVEQFAVKVGWLVLPFVVLLFVTNMLTIWSELRPLTRVSRLAAEIGPETVGRRLPEDRQPAEILPLIRSVNRALERLDRGFQVQRQFTADAAHELRTPLAVLAAHIDSLPDAQTANALRQEVAVMTRLVGQLLRIAELDALDRAARVPVDLQALAVEVASSLAPLALKAGKSIELTGAPAPVVVAGDREALHQAVRNLVENALQHAPPHTAVEIEVTAAGAIAVSDSGPGVPPELREQIFRRFFRTDRRKDGAGLGLAIVAKVAETHGGSVRVETARGGGARFVLQLRLSHGDPMPLDDWSEPPICMIPTGEP